VIQATSIDDLRQEDQLTEIPDRWKNGRPLTVEEKEAVLELVEKRRFSLDGEWPSIEGSVWDEYRFVPMKAWERLTKDQRRAVGQFLRAKGRCIRSCSVSEMQVMVHKPFPGNSARLAISNMSCTRFVVTNEWVRHSDCIAIEVENTEVGSNAVAMFREWLADMGRIGLAEVTGIEDYNA
jgi:hypothetical protein